MSALSQSKTKNYYKLLDSSVLPEVPISSARYFHDTLHQKSVERVVKSSHFVYIDMEEESGFQVMDKQVPSANEEEVQKIGNNLIWNLKNLSHRGQQTIDYLNKLREAEKQKQLLRQPFKCEMKRSLEKIKQRQNYKLNYDQMKIKKELTFDPVRLRQLVETEHLNSLNESILAKEKKLVEKLGITNSFILTAPDKPIKPRVVGKKLPNLNFNTIQK